MLLVYVQVGTISLEVPKNLQGLMPSVPEGLNRVPRDVYPSPKP